VINKYASCDFAEHYAKKEPELADFYKGKAEWTAKELAKIQDEGERKKVKDEVQGPLKLHSAWGVLKALF
jgi:hypothetical protein